MSEHIENQVNLIAPVINAFEGLCKEHQLDFEREILDARNACREILRIKNSDELKHTYVGKIDNNMIKNGKL